MAHRKFHFKGQIFNDGTEQHEDTNLYVEYSTITHCLYINNEMFDLDDAGNIAAIFVEIANARGLDIPINASEYRVFENQKSNYKPVKQISESTYLQLSENTKIKYREVVECYNSLMDNWHECTPDDWACNTRKVYILIEDENE